MECGSWSAQQAWPVPRVTWCHWVETCYREETAHSGSGCGCSYLKVEGNLKFSIHLMTKSVEPKGEMLWGFVPRNRSHGILRSWHVSHGLCSIYTFTLLFHNITVIHEPAVLDLSPAWQFSMASFFAHTTPSQALWTLALFSCWHLQFMSKLKQGRF